MYNIILSRENAQQEASLPSEFLAGNDITTRMIKTIKFYREVLHISYVCRNMQHRTFSNIILKSAGPARYAS